MANVLRHFLRVSISPNCNRNIILDFLIRIRVQFMRVLLKIVFLLPYWSHVSKSFPRPILDLSQGIFAITLSSSTTIGSLVLLNRVLLDRTCRGIHGVLNIPGSYLIVFPQTGCGKFFSLSGLTYGQFNFVPDMFTASESSARHVERSKYLILQGRRILPHLELVKHSYDQILHAFQKNLYSSKMS